MISSLLCFALACAGGTSVGPRTAHTPVDTLVDTVFVVSNRRRATHGFLREATDSLWYGLYVTQNVVADSNARAMSPMHVTRVDSAALDETSWRARLAAASRDSSARSAALVYVHGYSTSPGRAVAQGMQVKVRGGHRGPLVVFLWPTHDRYVTPPTPARAYNNDARAAVQSAPAFARLLLLIHETAPRVVVVMHSMGSRVALNAMLSDSATRAQLTARPLRAIGIFSPDVGAEQFRTAFAPGLPALAERVALYGAATDYLLGAAAIVNGERRASGITRRGAALSGIELIDDTRGARAEPMLLTLLGPRHAVRWASAALADFFSIVVAGAPPECRVTAATAMSEGEGRWRLTQHTMPTAWLGAHCTPVP